MANYTSGITYNTTNATTSGSFNVDWNTWTPGPITTGGSIPFTGTEFTTYTTPVQVPQCAHCLVRGAELRYAVTIVDGTAVCKEHAGLLLAIIEEEPDD